MILIGHNSAKQQTIQHIIDNLQISTLEYRNESDPDVLPYVHERKIELIQVLVTLYKTWIRLYEIYMNISEILLGFYG